MKYPLYILTALILLCTSVASAQTDLSWNSVPFPQAVDIKAIAEDEEGGLYAAVLPEGIYYAPPSTDGTRSWSPLGTGFKDLFGSRSDIISITVSKGSPRVIYVHVDRSRIMRLEPGTMVWKDVSYGLNGWEATTVVLDSRGNAYCITMDPAGGLGPAHRFDESARMWRSLANNSFTGNAESLIAGPSDDLFIGVIGRIYHSTDAGASWNLLVMPQDSGVKLGPWLALAPNGDLYGLWRNLWRSTDNGTTWTEVSARPYEGYRTVVTIGSQGDIYLHDPYSSMQSFYVSTDQGATWVRRGLEMQGRPMRRLAVGDHSYAASRGMLFRSDRGSTSWEEVPTVSLAEKTVVHAFDKAGGLMMIAHGSWLSVSADGGKSWKTEPQQPATTLRVDREGNLLAGLGLNMLRSTDSGATWVSRPMPVAGVVGRIRTIDDIEVDSLGRIYVLVTTSNGEVRMFLSEDDGATWEPRSTGVPAERSTLDLMLDPYNRLYAAVDSGGVFRSGDLGYNWDTMFDITQRRNIASLAFHPSGDVIAVGEGSIIRYDHATLQLQEQTFPGVELWDIAISPGGFCVVAASGGVMVSENGRDWAMSASWRDSANHISGGPDVPALWVDLDDEGNVYAGSRDHGIWRARIEAVSSAGGRAERTGENASLVLSPNPAADRLSLRYTLAEGGETTIVLYDLLGRSVLALPAVRQEQGAQSVDLDLRSLPAGAYIAEVKSGGTLRLSAPVVVRR